MTDHRAEALALIEGAAKTIHDVENRGETNAVEFIGALQVAGVSAAIASAKALVRLCDLIEGQNPAHVAADRLLAIYRDGLTAGIGSAFALYSPCESDQARAAATEDMVVNRMADPAFTAKAREQISARLDGAA